MLKQQGRPPFPENTLTDFRHFEHGIDLHANPPQLARGFKVADEFLQIVKRHIFGSTIIASPGATIEKSRTRSRQNPRSEERLRPHPEQTSSAVKLWQEKPVQQ